MSKVIFYHRGCAVFVDAEQQFVTTLNSDRYEVVALILIEELETNVFKC